jgi:hypothetical protein
MRTTVDSGQRTIVVRTGEGIELQVVADGGLVVDLHQMMGRYRRSRGGPGSSTGAS